MKRLHYVLWTAACLPALSAEPRCPWLNAATAGGVLGGPVQITVKADSCQFLRQAAGGETALRIEVVAASGPHVQCSSGAAPLKAIGNEARACSFDGKAGWTAEQVVGRVRDQAFLVRLSTTDKSATAKVLLEKVRSVAEQVAGILF